MTTITGRRKRAKDVPRLPLSAFSPTSDTFPAPVTPRAVVDAHHHAPPHQRAVVWTQPSLIARDVSVLTPFALDSTDTPPHPSPALTAVYDGAIPVAADAEGDTKDHAQREPPVRNLRWALQHARVVDLDIQDGIVAIDPSVYDSLVNLLTRATDTNHTPIVLTNALPPPLDSITPVVTLMNHPTYTTFRQRISSLSLFENVHVKLLPPVWVSTESTPGLQEKQEKEWRNILKLFIVPVLEAFGFERILFGSSPAFASGSPALSETWYKLVLESFRELAVSQDEINKIFVDNAERVYGLTRVVEQSLST